MQGLDVGQLPAEQFVDVMMEIFVQDALFEEDYCKARDKARVQTLNMMGRKSVDYDSTELYGSSNDTFGPDVESGPPMPYIEPTEQTEDGYVGLMPPMG